jgi:hypothetical protein
MEIINNNNNNNNFSGAIMDLNLKPLLGS